jgi:hypothetical protein
VSTTAAPAPPGPRTGRRGLLSFSAVTAGAVGAAVVLATLDPNQPGHYPTCPFLSITGLYCPGCGTLRAVHDGLHGDLAGALARNPLAVVAAGFLVVAWVSWGLRLLGRDAPHPTRIRPVWVWALLATVLVFGVLRNLPGFTWLSPA